jgi:N-acetylglucosaminyldiphosphoundecaprenol N-acetyl-beta-D-mannosaminyltransferase
VSGDCIKRVNVLGVGISAVDLTRTVDALRNWIDARSPVYVCVTPAHAVMDCRRDPELRRIHNRSGLTTPDGMSMVWLLRLHGHRHVSRVYGPDLLLATCDASQTRGWRHFFLGGAPGVAAKMVQRLAVRFPRLAVAGTASPPFRELSAEEDAAQVGEINAARPDIVWVGLGSPKQERWMAAHRDRLDAPVLVGVGAAFDFLSGRKAQAPRWLQRAGLEWLFRWATEPRRLAPRYGRYPLFVLLVLAQATGLARFDVE